MIPMMVWMQESKTMPMLPVPSRLPEPSQGLLAFVLHLQPTSISHDTTCHICEARQLKAPLSFQSGEKIPVEDLQTIAFLPQTSFTLTPPSTCSFILSLIESGDKRSCMDSVKTIRIRNVSNSLDSGFETSPLHWRIPSSRPPQLPHCRHTPFVVNYPTPLPLYITNSAPPARSTAATASAPSDGVIHIVRFSVKFSYGLGDYNGITNIGIREMQEQLVCRGCRTTLMYPRGAINVCCALCRTINPPQGMDMANIVCGGCGTMLMYTSSATSVRCSCCQTLNLVPAPSNQTARINCGHCRIILMYPYGASSVKCAVCQYVTNVHLRNGTAPFSMNRPNVTASPPTTMPSASTTQTVVVENPMSLDESGKLVSNVVVGVKTAKN
ncbi:unnamed protein product [Brassica oleracea]